MTMPALPDWTDACQRAEALRRALYSILSGQQAVKTEYMANGVSRSVRFAQTDLAALERELRLAEQLCANGGVPARRVHTVLLSTSKGV
jgi:hypothetical protein